MCSSMTITTESWTITISPSQRTPEPHTLSSSSQVPSSQPLEVTPRTSSSWHATPSVSCPLLPNWPLNRPCTTLLLVTPPKSPEPKLVSSTLCPPSPHASELPSCHSTPPSTPRCWLQSVNLRCPFYSPGCCRRCISLVGWGHCHIR